MKSQEPLGRLEEEVLEQCLEVLHTKGEFKMVLSHLRALKVDFETAKGRLDVTLSAEELHARYLECNGKVVAMETVLEILEV